MVLSFGNVKGQLHSLHLTFISLIRAHGSFKFNVTLGEHSADKDFGGFILSRAGFWNELCALHKIELSHDIFAKVDLYRILVRYIQVPNHSLED